MHQADIIVSLFVDPDLEQLKASARVKADYVELHTGSYANSEGEAMQFELERLISAAEHANNIGLKVNAGHGIDYDNINGILEIPHLCELNIGHSIVSRAVIVGMHQAVEEILILMKGYEG